MRTSLVTDALQVAASIRGGLDGSTFHSGHGAQYGSRAFADLRDQLRVTRSMGAGRNQCVRITRPARASTRP